MMTPVQQVVMAVIQITVLISIILLIVPFMTFAERKVIGYIQVRLGRPVKRVGFEDLLRASINSHGQSVEFLFCHSFGVYRSSQLTD